MNTNVIVGGLMLLISLPGAFAFWTRAAGVVAGVLFGIAALQIYAGQQVLVSTTPHTSALIGTAYGILTVAMIGWIVAVLRGEGMARA